ncbi:hypothetical protein EYR38_010587 [Pleurotus pulmonarius]|nr:hypothetical protein EYR38_010587 [Pleurotus pulmonarius]
MRSAGPRGQHLPFLSTNPLPPPLAFALLPLLLHPSSCADRLCTPVLALVTYCRKNVRYECLVYISHICALFTCTRCLRYERCPLRPADSLISSHTTASLPAQGLTRPHLVHPRPLLLRAALSQPATPSVLALGPAASLHRPSLISPNNDLGAMREMNGEFGQIPQNMGPTEEYNPQPAPECVHVLYPVEDPTNSRIALRPYPRPPLVPPLPSALAHGLISSRNDLTTAPTPGLISPHNDPTTTPLSAQGLPLSHHHPLRPKYRPFLANNVLRALRKASPCPTVALCSRARPYLVPQRPDNGPDPGPYLAPQCPDNDPVVCARPPLVPPSPSAP